MLHLTGCKVEHLFFSSFVLQENLKDVTLTSYQASGLCRYLWSKTLGLLALFIFYAMHLIVFCLFVRFGYVSVIVKLNHKFENFASFPRSKLDVVHTYNYSFLKCLSNT